MHKCNHNQSIMLYSGASCYLESPGCINKSHSIKARDKSKVDNLVLSQEAEGSVQRLREQEGLESRRGGLGF